MADMPQITSAVDTPLAVSAVLLPFLAFITVVIDTPPLVWHIQNRNLAAAGLVFWIILVNLMNTVNALIWPRDNIDQWWLGYGLCDVEIELMVGANLAGPGCVICIMRRLANVLDTDNTILSLSKSQRRKRLALELTLCFGVALLMMPINYIIQPSRYAITSIAGCITTWSPSWPTIVLVFMWPLIFCVIAAYYAGKFTHLLGQNCLLNGRSPDYHSTISISEEFFTHSCLIELEPNKTALCAPFSDGLGAHRRYITSSMLRSIYQHQRRVFRLQLE